MNILICGKGGCGKSVVTTLLAKRFSEKNFKVFVVDADGSNLGLKLMLGMDEPKSTLLDSLGGRRNVAMKIAKGLKKHYLTGRYVFNSLGLIRLSTVLSSNGKITFLQLDKVMVGGEGCFCPAQVILEIFLANTSKHGKHIVLVDMGAGVEFLGRGLNKNLVDIVLAVVDPTWDSIELTVRTHRMLIELGCTELYAVLNKIHSVGVEDFLTVELKKHGVKVLGSISYDPLIQISTMEGFPLKTSIAERDIEKICEKIAERFLGGR